MKNPYRKQSFKFIRKQKPLLPYNLAERWYQCVDEIRERRIAECRSNKVEVKRRKKWIEDDSSRPSPAA